MNGDKYLFLSVRKTIISQKVLLDINLRSKLIQWPTKVGHCCLLTTNKNPNATSYINVLKAHKPGNYDTIVMM